MARIGSVDFSQHIPTLTDHQSGCESLIRTVLLVAGNLEIFIKTKSCQAFGEK